jgi:hypothetical protein
MLIGPDIDMAMPQIAGLLLWRPGFNPTSGLMGFVVDNVVLGGDFLAFLFPFQFSLKQLLHVHHLSYH